MVILLWTLKHLQPERNGVEEVSHYQQSRESGLDASLKTPCIIAHRDVSKFRSPRISVIRENGAYEIEAVLSGGVPVDIDWDELQRRRSFPDGYGVADLCRVSSPLEVSNLGVSAALTVGIHDEKYLVVAGQRGSDGSIFFQLVSSYVDSGTEPTGKSFLAALCFDTILAKINEEVIPFTAEGQIRRSWIREGEGPAGRRERLLMPEVFKDSLPRAGTGECGISLTGVPACVRGADRLREVRIDRKGVPAVAYESRKTGSLQLVYGFDLTLPGNFKLHRVSLGQSENRPSENPGRLHTVFKPAGCLLLKLGINGEFTGDVFQLLGGELCEFGISREARFSEAFIQCSREGTVNDDFITFSGMFPTSEADRKSGSGPAQKQFRICGQLMRR